MSVFTVVNREQLGDWLESYPLTLLSFQGIAAGITNTNYFVTTDRGRLVLTLFETLTLDQLPFYLQLMHHLAARGIACPAPLADLQQRFASMLADRPACLVSCLEGEVIPEANPAQCFSVGQMLARLHVAAQDFPLSMINPRGPDWWEAVAPELYRYLSSADADLLEAEIAWQRVGRPADLPGGVIHADLFRDNVLMDGDQVAGFIDFYYACNDSWLYDLAIAANDWARDSRHCLEPSLAVALLAGYQSVRPLQVAEVQTWPLMLRAAALRFWVSRLLDLYQPMPGVMTYTKDPAVFRQLLLTHQSGPHDGWPLA